ncbi:NUDIX hydrolase [Paenibacillus flagellatus]|uniref:Hydrolase n=1 Tax=Paenibacillus flagellatus TaxID=2211139 RepID=A0A2V5KDS0_9BACL|nr:NUDIX domain-containing protein [Paenibacillus flagellatus]PYI52080.1 hydrolase [Paenibacillus flagellatus]
MKNEIFDIFDERMNRIGTASRSETHARGLWHKTFQCWIVARGPQGPSVLFQKRHPDKDTNPNLYDITCAGHLLAGETVEDGVRELEEELGVRASFADLIPIGVMPVEMEGAQWIDREFYHTFLYACDQPLDSYAMQPDEVVGLVRIDAAEASRLFAGQTGEVEAIGVETGKDGLPSPVRRLLRVRDFVPHGTAYYNRVLDAVLRHFL